MQRPRSDDRILYLDGLRGIAATIVYLGHFAASFFPTVVFGREHWLHASWERAFYATPLGIFTRGNYAVHLFLALSAFVMLRQVYRVQASPRFTALIGRYLRLMLPVAVSTVIAFILLRLSGSAFALAGEMSFSPWLANVWPPTATFLAAVREGVWESMWGPTANYNGVLWMLHFIWYGSIAVFAIGMFVRWPKLRVLLYVCGLLLTLTTAFGSFWVGALIFHFRRQIRKAVGRFPHANFLPLVLLFIAVVLGSIPAIIGDIPSVYTAFLKTHTSYFMVNNFINVLATVFTLLAALTSQQLQRILSTKPLVALGRVAFAAYLLHLLIIASLSSWLLVHFQTLPYQLAVGWIFLVTTVVLAISSVLFHRYVEKPTERFAHWVASL